MKTQKENAEILQLLRRAEKNGDDLTKLVEFFVLDVVPMDAHRMIDKLIFNHTLFFMSNEENANFIKEARDQIFFLQQLKLLMANCSNLLQVLK